MNYLTIFNGFHINPSFIKCNNTFQGEQKGLYCTDCKTNGNVFLGNKHGNEIKGEKDGDVDDKNKFLICFQCSFICHQHHSFKQDWSPDIEGTKCMCESSHCKIK